MPSTRDPIAVPANAEAFYDRATTLLQLGRYGEALATYESALAIAPNYAEALNNRGSAMLQLGRVAEALQSYEKAILIKPEYLDAINNRAAALIVLDRNEEALACYDKILAINPNSEKTLVRRGALLHKLQRYQEALVNYDRSLVISPDNIAAANNRGSALLELGRYEEALACFDVALRSRPDNVSILSNRSLVLQGLRRYDEALASCDRALAIAFDSSAVWNNRGLILQDLRRFDEALANYDEALKREPDDALAHTNRSMCLLLLGDFERGWQENEWRWRSKRFTSARRDFSQPLWLGREDISDKTILLHAEQGLGDTIQFVRYTASVSRTGAKIILEVPAVLKQLFSDIAGVSQIVSQGEPLPPFDFHCPLLSLPLAFDTRLDTIPASIPYISVAESTVTAWRKRLSADVKLVVGLCWKGSAHFRGDRDRSMRLEELRQLFSLPDVQFVSLQKDLDSEERAVTASFGNFTHPGADFQKTAEMVSALDLVISVDTVWAHWAGAIGKPFWLLLPFTPHWCWLLDRVNSPWYPTARLFRQTQRGEWAEVIREIQQEIVRTMA